MKAIIALYQEVLAVLPDGARRFINIYSSLLAFLAIFDAAALALLALIIGPLSTGSAVVLPLIGELDNTGVVWVIVAVCALMITKGVLSVLLLWWATRRIAKYEVIIGDRLFRAYISAPWVQRLRKNSTEIQRFTDGSVDITISGFILPGATLLGEAVSLITVIAVLAVVQPLIAVVTMVYLALVGAVLYFWVARHARIAGAVNLKYTLRTSRLIIEMVGAMKELTLRNKNDEVADIVTASRRHSSRARANVQFLAQVPRFVLESGIVGGFLVVGGAGFFLGGISLAITAVALFALAGFRMAPSVIRFQSVMSQMLSSAPHPRAVLAEIKEAEEGSADGRARPTLPLPATPRILRVEGVTFRYSPDSPPAVDNVSLEIAFGSTVAFVGESGSGKSTMIDLLIGLVEPNEGRITIDGVDLNEVIKDWRSRIGYVPQDVSLLDGTIAQNVSLTWSDAWDSDAVRQALGQAQLGAFVDARADGLNGSVGERGLALSGGQKQRLGIARALYAEPLILVMDEATSALDTQTEAAVSEAIGTLSGRMTRILVAHRLATVQHADQIFFMSAGKLVGAGTFAQLVGSVPEFARQARLAGLA